MKSKYLLVLGVLFMTSIQSGLAQDNWYTNLQEAKAAAKASNQNVLVYFSGSDWCKPCIKLKEDLFDTASFEALAKNYVLLYIDIPRNRDLLSADQFEHNQEVMHSLNPRKVFPMIKVLAPRGRELDALSGYGMNGDVSAYLNLLERNQ